MALWMCLCGKMLPPITNWFRVHRSAKRLPFSFNLSQSMCPHDALITCVVHSNLGIQISHQYGYVLWVESYTSDIKIGTPVATLSGAWNYRVSTGTGWPSVSIL